MAENTDLQSEKKETNVSKEFVFDEEPIKPKWFSNKVITFIGIFGVILIVLGCIYFIKNIWPDLYVIIQGKNTLIFSDNAGMKSDAKRNIILYSSRMYGKLVYLELLGIPGIICLLIFILNYVRQVLAKKRQDERRKKKEQKFNKENSVSN